MGRSEFVPTTPDWISNSESVRRVGKQKAVDPDRKTQNRVATHADQAGRSCTKALRSSVSSPGSMGGIDVSGRDCNLISQRAVGGAARSPECHLARSRLPPGGAPGGADFELTWRRKLPANRPTIVSISILFEVHLDPDRRNVRADDPQGRCMEGAIPFGGPNATVIQL